MTKATNAAANLAGSVTNQLRDIKPPVEIPNGWAWLGWTLLGLALAAGAYALWRYWLKRKQSAPRMPEVLPHVRAKERLRQALQIIHQPKEFCIMVSDTIRWYLEKRFDFHAPERTTEEFLHELQSTNLLNPEQKRRLGEFLERCDLVKFARYEPREAELHDLHDAALKLVEETQPDPFATATPAEAPAK